MDYTQIQLTDNSGNLIMPVTTTNEILTSDGINLEQEIKEIKDYIESLKNKTEVKY